MTHPLAPEHPHKNTRTLKLAIAIFIGLGIAYLAYWWLYSRFYEWTDDAYVNGNMVIVTPQVPGIVQMFTVQNTEFVSQGYILVELDKTDATIALERTKAELSNAVREVAHLIEDAKQMEALVLVKKALFIQAAQDYEHRKMLVDSGGVSLEDFEHSEASLQANYADLVATEHQWISALSLVENTTVFNHPKVEQAKNLLRDAFVSYERCTIKAPVSGLIAQRTVQVGERVKAGEPLMAIIPLDEIWIDANYKETQLAHVRIGQPTTVRADLYGGAVLYQGKVVGIAGGTGSVFSVLPPQNATGNWIKIVQRLPVRIQLDPEQIKHFPLRLGLSVETKIDLHDTHGPIVPPSLPQRSLYSTDVFAKQEEGAEAIIMQIIAENTPNAFQNSVVEEE